MGTSKLLNFLAGWLIVQLLMLGGLGGLTLSDCIDRKNGIQVEKSQSKLSRAKIISFTIAFPIALFINPSNISCQ